MPGQGFLFESLLGADALVQALAGKGGEFDFGPDFGPVEPGAVLGGVVEFELVAQLTGRFDGPVRRAGSTGRFSYNAPSVWGLQLSCTSWIVAASG